MIRPYQPSDRDAVYDICVRTADAGEDSRHLYPDTLLMPSIFAGPYVTLEPSLAFVLDDGGPVGYVVGTADTETFVARYRSEWLPGLLSWRRTPRTCTSICCRPTRERATGGR